MKRCLTSKNSYHASKSAWVLVMLAPTLKKWVGGGHSCLHSSVVSAVLYHKRYKGHQGFQAVSIAPDSVRGSVLKGSGKLHTQSCLSTCAVHIYTTLTETHTFTTSLIGTQEEERRREVSCLGFLKYFLSAVLCSSNIALKRCYGTWLGRGKKLLKPSSIV